MKSDLNVELVFDYRIKVDLAAYAKHEAAEMGFDIDDPLIPEEMREAVAYTIISEHQNGMAAELLRRDLEDYLEHSLGAVGVSIATAGHDVVPLHPTPTEEQWGKAGM